MKPIHEVIKYTRTEEEVAREWAGIERRAPVAPLAEMPVLKPQRSHYAIALVGVVCLAASVAILLTGGF